MIKRSMYLVGFVLGFACFGAGYVHPMGPQDDLPSSWEAYVSDSNTFFDQVKPVADDISIKKESRFGLRFFDYIPQYIPQRFWKASRYKVEDGSSVPGPLKQENVGQSPTDQPQTVPPQTHNSTPIRVGNPPANNKKIADDSPPAHQSGKSSVLLERIGKFSVVGVALALAVRFTLYCITNQEHSTISALSEFMVVIQCVQDGMFSDSDLEWQYTYHIKPLILIRAEDKADIELLLKKACSIAKEGRYEVLSELIRRIDSKYIPQVKNYARERNLGLRQPLLSRVWFGIKHDARVLSLPFYWMHKQFLRLRQTVTQVAHKDRSKRLAYEISLDESLHEKSV